MGLNDDIYEQMGKLIRARRKNVSLTQDELGQRVNLARTSITNIERGRQKIQIHTLFEIAAALDVVPAALIPKVNSPAIEAITERVRGLPSGEREFARSVLVSKSE